MVVPFSKVLPGLGSILITNLFTIFVLSRCIIWII